MANNIPQFSNSIFIPLTGGRRQVNEPSVSNANNDSNDSRSKKLKRNQADVSVEEIVPVPWMKRTYSPGVVGLHEEILDFCEVLSPTEEEMEIRFKVVEHIEHVVTSMWPEAKVEVFGSFVTGLSLPSSDLDIVVSGKWEQLPLHTLEAALIQSGIKSSDISVLSNARVPIIRLVHSATKVKVDISFNVRTGIKSAMLIKGFIRLYPALPKLVLVLKQFLIHRGLNEVYYGGMSSYTLTILVISFLQGNHRPKNVVMANLGMLLLEFFELYGINFNYDNVSLSINDGGFYRPKVQMSWESYLSIDDPLCAGGDIAKGTYLMYQIKRSFENAYNILHRAVTETYSHNRPSSILQLILDVEPEIFVQREWLRENFNEVLKTFPMRQKRAFPETSQPNRHGETSTPQVTQNIPKNYTIEKNVQRMAVVSNPPGYTGQSRSENGFEKQNLHKNVMSAKQEWRSAQNRSRAPFNAKDSHRYKRNSGQLSKNSQR